MKFTKSLIKGKLIKRYKRFFTDIKLNKGLVTAHCPNTGSMMGLLDEGNEVFISKNDNPKRKLKYTLEIIKVKNRTKSSAQVLFAHLYGSYNEGDSQLRNGHKTKMCLNKYHPSL